MSEGGAILRAVDLGRRLGSGAGEVEALRSVSLELKRRESCAIVGPSGCGKSTLLYLLGLLDRPDQGELILDGEEVSRMSDRRRTAARLRKIGFVFQFHFLLAEYTALENVLLPILRLGELSKKEAKGRAEELLEKVGLIDKSDRKGDELSGGEQQRVAVARALANRPEILLADEPTGNLDEATAGAVTDLLLRTAIEDRCAVVMVTHNRMVADACGRQLSMRDGEIVGER